MTRIACRRATCCATLAALIQVGSCADEDGSSRGHAVAWRTERLIAGDTTIVRTIGASAPGAQLSLLQELSIGKLDGAEHEMYKEVTQVTPTPDGGVLFYDSGTGKIRRFDSAGVYMHAIGRKGQGPGEFTSAYRIDMMPDGKVLVEADISLNMYDSSGASVRDQNIEFEDPSGYGSQQAVTPDGLIHILRRIYDPRYPDSMTGPGRRLTTQVAQRLTFLGEPMDTAFRPEPRSKPVQFEYTSRGRPATRSIPLAPSFIVAYSTSGYWISGGDDGSYTILLHRREGGPLRIESDLPRVSAGEAERQTALHSLLYYVTRWDPAAAAKVDIIPTVKPAFSEITTDSDGRLWVKLHTEAVREEVDTMPLRSSPERAGFIMEEGIVFAGEGNGPYSVSTTAGNPKMRKATERWVEADVYDVFAPSGEFLGRIRLPERATFGNARGDRVWLVVKDELDVPTVVRFRVMNPAKEGAPAPGWR